MSKQYVSELKLGRYVKNGWTASRGQPTGHLAKKLIELVEIQ